MESWYVEIIGIVVRKRIFSSIWKNYDAKSIHAMFSFLRSELFFKRYEQHIVNRRMTIVAMQ